jgi:hypothetical protein
MLIIRPLLNVRRQTLRGQRSPFAGIHRSPLLEIDQPVHLPVEREHRDLIRGRGFLQNAVRPISRIRPQVVPTHAGTCVPEHDDLLPGGGLGIRNHRRLQKRARKPQCQQTQHKTA